MNVELMARIDRAEAVSWLGGLRDLSRALPLAMVETWILERHGCHAFATPGTPLSMFNRVLCLDESHLADLDALLAFYQRHDIPPRIDVCPFRMTSAIAAAFERRGLVVIADGSYARRLWQAPQAIVLESSEGPDVQPLTEETVGAWLTIDEAVWPGSRGDRAAKLRATLHEERFHRFLAFVDDQPVALGRLEVIDGIAVLNGAGTLPSHRRRGCQRALTRRRIEVARNLGCDAVTSLVDADSQSEMNLRKSGLSESSDRLVWMPPDWKSHPFYDSRVKR